MGLEKWWHKNTYVGETTTFVMGVYFTYFFTKNYEKKDSFNKFQYLNTKEQIEELLKLVRLGLDKRCNIKEFIYQKPNIADKQKILEEYKKSGAGLIFFVIAILAVEKGWKNKTFEKQKMLCNVMLDYFYSARIKREFIFGPEELGRQNDVLFIRN